jgi:glycine oxidase
MSPTADVVVLGAGVAGCATAYYLASEGVNVKVVERDAIGSCASGFAVGLLNPLTGTGIPGPMEPFAKIAFEMHKELWPVLQERGDVDIQVRLIPHLELFLTPEDAAAQQEEIGRWSRAEGFSTRWLGPDDVHRMEPRITRDVHSAVLLENIGVVDSYRFTLALAQAAESHGAEFLHGEVVGLNAAGGKVTGVKLEQGEIACETVVVALGPWSDDASDWLGVSIPVEPLKGEILYLDGMDPPLEYNLNGPCLVTHKADGFVWIAATLEKAGFDDTTTVSARDWLMKAALTIMPSLGQQGLVRQTACLRPVTPDSQPILGKSPGLKGVYLATGAERKGILIGPAMGRAVADLIIRGETSLPIAPFAAERFARGNEAPPG